MKILTLWKNLAYRKLPLRSELCVALDCKMLRAPSHRKHLHYHQLRTILYLSLIISAKLYEIGKESAMKYGKSYTFILMVCMLGLINIVLAEEIQPLHNAVMTAERQEAKTPQQVLQRLKDGNQRF